ncbi:DUF192 domain-containing protein [Pararhodobacter zhoushanensis]|uniref:DUF192 domain-containing protein n=1 Tax=Pararhodobacter zhoushanensis TaxID=2479545 RepID=A0ABT3GY73_9RHOB|nr:DUF192 domain-containing protein [Pararhodobacter zhoushanensis]MCW1932478.1 DUF192 domain-containing protein [Pararhodobacter zhoushanensis]
MVRNGFVGVVLAFVLGAGQASASACSQDHVQLRGDFGQAAFTVEVADTESERAQGLMHRESMPRFSGMLFVFDAPQRAVFWMENTLIPLDMLFLDAEGVVQTVHANAIPLDRTGIDGGFGIKYVLEINGGMAERLNIEEGAVLRHPAIAQDTAAWPCD